ncbi:MAG: Na+/H+ antiporter subunit E, partial [Campylobacterota bacterium]|nr:Na+/H+ antiporter subunit E [Campylobacterota bacterium]
VKANIEVAKIVLRPKIQINPGIVKLKTTLCDDFDKLLLANAITLTPGTITMELHEKNLYVHVLDVQSEDKQILQEQIISPFEEVIKS